VQTPENKNIEVLFVPKTTKNTNYTWGLFLPKVWIKWGFMNLSNQKKRLTSGKARRKGLKV